MERDATSQEATKVQDRTNEWSQSSKIVFATKVNDSKMKQGSMKCTN